MLHNNDIKSTKMKYYSKNYDEEDGAFYTLNSLARNEIKRSNYYYTSNEKIRKDKLEIKNQIDCLEMYSSLFKGLETSGYDFKDGFHETEHYSLADLGQKRTQRGPKSSLIFISKGKQNKMDADIPAKKTATNISPTICINKETKKSDRNSKISTHINNYKIKNFENYKYDVTDGYPSNNRYPYLNTESYKNESNNFHCSESFIDVQGIYRWKEQAMLKKYETKSIKKEACLDESTQSFDKEIQSVNTHCVTGHSPLLKKEIRNVETRNLNELLRDNRTSHIFMKKSNLSRKNVKGENDTSTSDSIKSKTTHTNAKSDGSQSDAASFMSNSSEMDYLQSCHKDYSRMTKDERMRELKRIYGMHLPKKSQRRVHLRIQQPEWEF